MVKIILIFILFKCTASKYTKVEVENLSDYLVINACRERQKLIDSDRNQKFELVESPLGGRLKLDCHYCDEIDDYVPKMWYKQSRFKNNNITEVELGMEDILKENRVYITPDHVLVINEIIKDDAGLYFCKGLNGEDSEFKYNYLIDVVNNTRNISIGKPNDLTRLNEVMYRNASRIFASSNRSDYEKIRKMGINITVNIEWLPWAPCDGCKKIRTRKSTCKLKSDLANSKAVKMSSKIMSNVSSITSFTDEEIFLIKSFEMSCFSLDLERIFPMISKDLSTLEIVMITEPCFAPCKFQFKSESLPRYKNVLTLKEGDHFTLICPESDAFSEITWKKDGATIEPFSEGENILLDSFRNLVIIYATEDENANFTCYVGKVRMQEIIVIVRTESILASSEFSRYIIYLGFILFLNFLLYISVLVISYKRRHSFAEIDFTNYEDNLKPLMKNYEN